MNVIKLQMKWEEYNCLHLNTPFEKGNENIEESE